MCFAAPVSVRARRRPQSATRPPLVQIFWPFIDEVIAPVLGASTEARQVGARAGLRVELAPELLGRQDLPEVPPLLRLGAVHDDGRPHDRDAQGLIGAGAPARAISSATIACWSGRRAAPPVRNGPSHADVARVVEPAVPGSPLLERRGLRAGNVRLEPAPGGLAELDVLGRVAQIHVSPPRRPRASRPHDMRAAAAAPPLAGRARQISVRRGTLELPARRQSRGSAPTLASDNAATQRPSSGPDPGVWQRGARSQRG